MWCHRMKCRNGVRVVGADVSGSSSWQITVDVNEKRRSATVTASTPAADTDKQAHRFLIFCLLNLLHRAVEAVCFASLELSVLLFMRQCVHASETMFPRYLQCLLMDFRETLSLLHFGTKMN